MDHIVKFRRCISHKQARNDIFFEALSIDTYFKLSYFDKKSEKIFVTTSQILLAWNLEISSVRPFDHDDEIELAYVLSIPKKLLYDLDEGLLNKAERNHAHERDIENHRVTHENPAAATSLTTFHTNDERIEQTSSYRIDNR